jgi:signal transduction histidine kinase
MICRWSRRGSRRPWDESDRLSDDAHGLERRYVKDVTADAISPPLRRLSWMRREMVLPVLLAGWVQFDVWAPLPFSFVHMVGPRAIVALLYAVTSLALVWRKRAPLAVLAFVMTCDAAEYLAFGAPEALGSFLPPFLAFYSVGRYARASSLTLAGPLVLLGFAVHELKDPALGFPSFLWLVLATAWPLGHAFQLRAAEAQALAGRVGQLAEEREESARAAVASERARIARELHDVVGHGLSVIVLQLVAALAILEKSDTVPLRERLLSTERSARDALAEMRRLLGLLDNGEEASLAPQPRLDQLERLIADTCAAGAEVDLTITGEPLDLPAGVELATFRILQESLTNVLKHARPPRAHVRVAYEPDAIVIEVRDEGQSASAADPGGRGLPGIRERVALYSGELELGRAPEGGYAVRVRLPLPG